jgi:CBS domain containing-hemolysin-like protein
MTAPGVAGLESAVLLLILAGLAAVQARAVRGAQRMRIAELCRGRGRPEHAEQIVAASETIAFIAASVVVLAAAVATLLVARRVVAVSGGVRAVEVSALAGWILLEWLVLVVVPMLVTRVAGAWIVVATWRLWRPIVGLVAPAVRGLGAAAGAINAGTQGPDGGPPPDELRLVVDEAHRDGRIEGAARDMIRGVIGLDQVKVAQIMTPRTRMVSIPLADGWEGAVRRATESGHTRLPVYDRSSDDVVGILHTRDLLTRLADAGGAGERAVRGLLRPPWFVPESLSVQTLLLEFQRGKTHMAIVTDEFGGVSGLVTIEDALEEIVGEIADEHDEAFSDGIRTVSPTVCEVLAHVPVARLNERLGLALPEEEGYETLGGFLFHRCGRIPEVGDRVEVPGAVLEVLAATRRRVDLVRVERRGGDGTDVG